MSYIFSPDEHRTMHFKTTGVVVYDPVRAGKVAKETGWCVVDVNADDLMSYYAWQFYKKFGIVLDKPSWSPHLSVIVGEGSYNEDIPWKYRDGEIVEVEYSHYIFWNENHVWIAASCVALDEIREHYQSVAKDRGHLTIGRIPKKQQNAIPVFTSFKDVLKWKEYPFNTPLI